MIVYAAGTKKGPGKKINEDRIFVNREVISEGSRNGFMENSIIVVICDGVGGEQGGDMAASEVATSFMFVDAEKMNITNLVNHLIMTNRYLLDNQKRYPLYSKMATTIVGILITGKNAICWHIGDSRVYEYRNHQLIQLTEDHTVAQNKRRYSYIYSASPLSDTDNNTLTRYMGGRGRTAYPSLRVQNLNSDNAFFLLCSDGVYKNVTHKDMVSVLEQNLSLEKKQAAILHLTVKNGCDDDASIVLIGVT